MTFELRVEVKPVRVTLHCDECSGGEMKPTGVCLYTYPARYEHKCENCGHIENIIDKTYPYIKYEIIKGV